MSSTLQRSVIAPNYTTYLIHHIRNSNFSFTVHEITDEANILRLAITERCFSEKKKSLVDTFHRLGPLEDYTTNIFHRAVRKCTKEDGLNIENLISTGCNGANAIVGLHHSLVTLLKNDNPFITVFRCVYHSLHLTANLASEMLPAVLTFIALESHYWFSNSPKRIKKYRDLSRHGSNLLVRNGVSFSDGSIQ